MNIDSRLSEIKEMEQLPSLIEKNRLVSLSYIIDDWGPVAMARDIDLLFEDFLILNEESYKASIHQFSIDPHMLNSHYATLRRIKDLLLDIYEFEEHYKRVEKEKKEREALEQKKVA